MFSKATKYLFICGFIALLAPSAALFGMAGTYALGATKQSHVFTDAGAEPFFISAERIEYDNNKKEVYATGNIRISTQDLELECDELKYLIETGEVRASGNILLRDPSMSIRGETAVYNINSNTGRIYKANVFVEPSWYCYGEVIERIDEKTVILISGYVTSCDRTPPHYRFQARRIRVKMEDSIFAAHLLVYGGSAPVFYFPYYWQPLKKIHADIDVRFGSSSSEGAFVKVRYTQPLTEYLKARIFLDYMTRRGFGEGLKLEYNWNDSVRGYVFGYYNRDKSQGADRWNTQLEHWQRAGGRWIIQSRLDLMSEWSINRDTYAGDIEPEENWLRYTPHMHSYAAATRSADKSTARFYINQHNEWDGERYEATEGTMPGFAYVMYPSYMARMPFLTSYSFNMERNLRSGPEDIFYRWEQKSALSLTKRLVTGRRSTLTPGLRWEEQWTDRRAYDDTRNLFTQFAAAHVDHRASIGRSLESNIGYAYRTRIPHQTQDSVIYARPRWRTRNTTLRMSSGYHIAGLEEGLYDPLTTELELAITRSWDFYTRHIYNINTGKNNYLQSELYWRLPARSFFVFTRGEYFRSSPDEILMTHGTRFPLYNKWNMSGQMQYIVYNRGLHIDKAVLSQRRLQIERDLHCWIAKIIWRRSRQSQEFWLLFSLKVFPESSAGIYHHAENKEWQFKSD